MYQLQHYHPTVCFLFLTWCEKVVHNMFGSLRTHFYTFPSMQLRNLFPYLSMLVTLSPSLSSNVAFSGRPFLTNQSNVVL